MTTDQPTMDMRVSEADLARTEIGSTGVSIKQLIDRYVNNLDGRHDKDMADEFGYDAAPEVVRIRVALLPIAD